MLGPRRFEAAPAPIAKLMEDLQDWTLRDIARRLAKNSVISSYSEYQLTRLSELRLFEESLQAKLAEVSGLAENEVKTLFEQAANANYIYDKRVFEDNGILFVPFEKNTFLQNLTANIISQTNGELCNITQSLGYAVRSGGGLQFLPVARVYQDTLDFAITQITTGITDAPTALRLAVNTLAESGLRTVSYATGRKDRADVAARRAVMGGLRDLTNRQSEANAGQMGVATFEISWHGGHRPSHGWGGRRYDTTGRLYPTPEELYAGYGGGTPEDYNCYHEVYAVFPDAPPNYTDAELRALEARELETRTFEGEQYNAYEARQQQRKIERAMRLSRQKAAGYEAAGLSQDAVTMKGRYMRQRGLYKEFSDAMGLRTEFERVYTGYANAAARDIIKNKLIPVTSDAIQNVPLVQIPGFTDEQNKLLQKRHKDILRYIREDQVGTEGVAYYDMNLNEIIRRKGEPGVGSVMGFKIDVPHITIHNHPDGEIFTHGDLKRFKDNENTLVMTAVGNNGGIYLLSRLDAVNEAELAIAFDSLMLDVGDFIKAKDEAGYRNRIAEFLQEVQRYGFTVSRGKS